MGRRLQFKRGAKAKLPILSEGEPGWVVDEEKLYMGTGVENIPIAPEAHSHTAGQVGADPAGSAAAVQSSLDRHTTDRSNPHGVTAAQVGAAAAGHTHTAAQVGADPAGSAAGVQNSLNAHTGNRSNPHGVTAAQIGAEPAGSAAAMLPRGVIAMWSGSAASIPSGWALCNGQNGTPNLLDRFIVGAGSGYAPGAVGGAAAVTLAVNELPVHSHSASASAGAGGAHNHAGSLMTDSAGEHGHTTSTPVVAKHDRVATMGGAGYVDCDIYNGSSGASTGVGGAHAHTGSFTTSTAADHSHVISIGVGNAGNGAAHENRPPYYALCFIMRL